MGGTPDIIMNLHKKYNSFSTELETQKGNGIISDKVIYWNCTETTIIKH